MADGLAAGFLNGLADSKNRKTAREDRLREISVMETMANRPITYSSEAGGDPGGAPRAGSGAGNGGGAYTYDGAISDRPNYAYQKFVAAGVPDHVAAGLVGNLMQESGPDINPAAVGDNGNAFGSGQWNGPRMRAYMDYASSRGVEPTDFDTQLDFLLHEGQTSEKGAWSRIMAAKTAEEAAVTASNSFWRPGTPHNERRAGYATAVYSNRAKTAPPAQEQTARPPISLLSMGVEAQEEPNNYSWFRNRMKKGK